MIARRSLLAGCALVAIAACRSWEPASPRVTAVVPGTVTLDVPTAVTIEGRRFRNDLEASLDDSGGASVDDDWAASVAGIPLSGVVRVNDTALNAVVPAGVPLGTHDVEVLSPAGKRAVLPAGLTVVEAVPSVEITSLTLPSGVVPEQEWVPVTIVLANGYPQSLPLVGARLSFLSLGNDAGDDYAVFADTKNPVALAASSSTAVLLWVNVRPGADAFGNVEVIATARAAISTNGAMVNVDASGSWLLADAEPPPFTLEPLPEAGRKRCVGDAVAVAVAGTGVSVTWSFENGTPASVTGTAAVAAWSEPGAWFYAATGTDLQAIANTRRPVEPVLVGWMADPPSKTHVTGPLKFDRPLPGEALDIGDLGTGDELLPAAQSLGQCDGSPLAGASSNDYVTVFADRGVLDPDEDDRAGVEGIQRFIAGGNIAATTLAAGSPALEGPANLYAETRDDDGVVTGAAWIPFSFSGDLEPPVVAESLPPADCTAACLAPGDQIWFRLSEPLDAGTFISGVQLTWAPGAVACTAGGFTAATATVGWDDQAWTLAIAPPASGPGTTWTVHAELDVADTALAANPLAASRCVVFGGAPAPVPAAPVAVTQDLLQFSPDGDEDEDEVVFTFEGTAGASRARLEIWRDLRRIATVSRAATGAGPHTLVWDGRDGRAAIVRDGWVEWRLILENAAGDSSPAVQGILQVESGVSRVGPPFPVP